MFQVITGRFFFPFRTLITHLVIAVCDHFASSSIEPFIFFLWNPSVTFVLDIKMLVSFHYTQNPIFLVIYIVGLFCKLTLLTQRL